MRSSLSRLGRHPAFANVERPVVMVPEPRFTLVEGRPVPCCGAYGPLSLAEAAKVTRWPPRALRQLHALVTAILAQEGAAHVTHLLA